MIGPTNRLYEKLKAYGPVSSSLSKLVRPAIQAPEGKVLVWGDWSAIEARINPWLANTRTADTQVLQLFRDGTDIYIENAKDIFGVSGIDKTTPEGSKMRQSGKIAVLSLGFLGGAGALRQMARGYGLRLGSEEARHIVHGWRDRNTWARAFGNAAWEALCAAIDTPGAEFQAGRLTYTFDKDMMGGTLLCWLPSGRPLVYPFIRMGVQEKPNGEEEFAVSYRHGNGRSFMWSGKAIQGPTQAVAADMLRDLLRAVDKHDNCVAHTHDECVLEVDERDEDHWKKRLLQLMLLTPKWADDKLPIAAEVESDFYYHK